MHDPVDAHDAPRADFNAGHDEGPSADECILANSDPGGDELKGGMRKIVAARTEVSLLGDGSASADFDFAKTVSVRAIAQAGSIAQGEVPGNGDASALMHKRSSLDRSAEKTEPEEPPGIRRLRCPNAKDKPAKFPEQSQRPVWGRPGRFLGHTLLGYYRRFCFHLSSETNQAERQPWMNTDFQEPVPPGLAITAKSESVARSISKRFAKDFLACSRMLDRASAGLASQRLSKLMVPARSSFST